MNPAVRQAIARIDVRQGNTSASRGTGALVTSDLVLTAMHVVADRSAPTLSLYAGTITLTFPGHVTEAHVVDRGWNPSADWILLRCVTPPTFSPLPLADSVSDGATWETYGFPDANPRDGMVQIGTVENAAGVFENVPAYQLFSNQAAAGAGAPVKGLSGGPVVVDGALVAVLRSSLMRDGLNVAGTLYGCPVDVILQSAGDLLPVPDPCRGLPGLPQQPLPSTPFRFLERFTATDAEIFFGRNREIRHVRDAVVAADGPPVVLLYGPSGAGKSSFLDAGLLPRLAATHAVLYLRRERDTGLLATLLKGIRSQAAERDEAAKSDDVEALRLAWLDAEGRAGKPLVVVLDQVEEAFTLPTADANELTTFFDALAGTFSATGGRPRGRIVLGFRKEWFAEIQKQLETRGVEYGKVFLEAFDALAIVEIVNGLRSTRRLRDRYGLELENGLAEKIARDLTADADSPVAPTLQVLLSKMWREATALNAHAPQFSDALYQRLNKDGVLLTDFFDQQLETLARNAATAGGTRADVVSSGLALDLLLFHTTTFGSAEQRTADEIAREYAHRAADAAWLVQELKRLYLLADAAGDTAQAAAAARLSHDTLAQVVRARFDVSPCLGQRARRVLQNRATEWTSDRSGTPLDARDLELVQQGLSGMRQLRPDEQRLLDASRVEADRRRLSDTRRRTLALVALGVIVVMAGVAGWLRLQEQRQQEWSALFLTDATVPTLLDIEPVNGLVAAIEAIARNLELNDGTLLPGSRTNLAVALALARERASWTIDAAANGLAISIDNRVAVGTNDGNVLIFSLDGTASIPPIRAAGAGSIIRSVAFSADGEWLAAAAGRQGIGVWNRKGQPLSSEQTPNLPLGLATAVEFAPDGHTLLVAFTDNATQTLYVCDLNTAIAKTVSIASKQPITALAAARTSSGQLIVAAAGGDVAVWTVEGKRLWQPAASVEGIRTADLVVVRDSPPRVLIAAGSVDGSVTVWDASASGAGATPKQLTRLAYAVSAVSFGSGGRLLHVSGSTDGVIRSFDVAREREAIESLVIPGQPQALVASADGERLVALAVRSTRTSLQVFDMIAPELLFPLGPAVIAGQEDVPTRINAIAFAGPDSVIAGIPGRLIPRWQLSSESAKPSAQLTMTTIDSGSDETTAVAASVQGDVLVLAGETVRFVVGDKSIAGASPLPARATAAAITPDGNTAVVGSENGAITVWNARTGQLTRAIDAHEGAVWALSFNREATLFASGGEGVAIKVWTRDGQPQSTITRAENATTALTYLPDGTLMAGDGTGLVQRFAADGRVVHAAQLFRHEIVTALLAHPGDDTVFVAGPPGIRLFDTGSSVVLDLKFPRHARGGASEGIRALAIRADGALLAAANGDGEVLLWRAHWHTWLREACDRLAGHQATRSASAAGHIVSGKDKHGVDCQAAFDACSRLAWSGPPDQ